MLRHLQIYMFTGFCVYQFTSLQASVLTVYKLCRLVVLVVRLRVRTLLEVESQWL